MEQVFSYIISLGASVMMPIIFTVIGLCIGMKFGKALKSGLFVGVGFVGLGVVTALLTKNFNDPLKLISDIYHLQLNVFDMGWPAAAAVAYNTAVGALIIPICLGVNFLMLITKTTRTVNIDLWNYWHFAFIGAVAYFVMGESLLWGYFAAIVCYIITLVCADLTAEKFQKYYDLDGISIPQPFCQSFMPFAIGLNKLLDMIPGFSKLDIDAEGLKKKFGVLGEPYDVEKGAGTMNPFTFLRVLGPEPWNVAYVEPSRRPADGRYGDNPNRLYQHHQFQVIMKPSPDNIQELYLASLERLGINPKEHDIRFVEDNWESPTLGAWGLGWEVWLDGMEITQFTYFQQVGSQDIKPTAVEITYGLERLAMYIQGVENVYDIQWTGDYL